MSNRSSGAVTIIPSPALPTPNPITAVYTIEPANGS